MMNAALQFKAHEKLMTHAEISGVVETFHHDGVAVVPGVNGGPASLYWIDKNRLMTSSLVAIPAAGASPSVRPSPSASPTPSAKPKPTKKPTPKPTKKH